jgi:RNA polymerase sigma factor (sigma-70 family)
VAAARSGDDRAFEQLYQRYQRRIAAYVHGMVKDHGRAEDITQEVFMSALRRMRETDRPIIFKPWIYEIAKNACIDAFRRSRRAEEVSYDAEDGLGASDHVKLVSSGPTPDAAVDTRMALDDLRGAFGGLSDSHHEILVMRELEGLSYREIGERLGMSRPSVESTLFRARRRLTEEYQELASGKRCSQFQGLIAQAAEVRLGARDERKMARHVSHCQACRRVAGLAGIDVAALAAGRGLREKIAALLPLPAFLKRRWLGAGNGGAGNATVANLSVAAGSYAEPMAGWAKAAVLAATVAVAGAGAGVATSQGDDVPANRQAAPPAETPDRGPGSGSASGGSGAGAVTGTGPGAAAAGGVPGATGAGPGGPAAGGASGSGSPAGSVTNGAGKAVDGVQKKAGAGAGAATGAVNNVVNGTGEVVKRTTGAVGGVVNKTTSTATGTLNRTTSGATGAVKKTTSTATGAINKTTSTATGAVNKTTSTATGAVKKTTGAVTGAVDKVTSGATAPVSNAVKRTTSTASGAATKATGAVSTTATKATGAATGAATQATGAATGVATQATGAATGAATKATTTATGAVDKAAGSATGAATGAVGGILGK